MRGRRKSCAVRDGGQNCVKEAKTVLGGINRVFVSRKLGIDVKRILNEG